MKGNESDELRRAEVVAHEHAAHGLARIAYAMEAPDRERQARELAAHRRPLTRIFGGERGAVLLLRSIPGFADLWDLRVPGRALLETRDRAGEAWCIVCCECGEHSAMRPGHLAECPGGCGRWFLHAGPTVRVKRFDTQPVEAAA